MLHRFRAFLSNATPGQRCVFAILANIPFLLAFMAAPSWGFTDPKLERLLNPAAILTGVSLIAGNVAIQLGILAWLWPRRHSRRKLPRLYATLAVLLTSGFSVPPLLGGNLTFPASLVIICLVPCGLLVLDMRASAIGVALGVFFIWINDLAIFTGLLPYAPGYSPNAFNGDSQVFMAEVLRTGILYVNVTAYGLLIWILFDQFDFHQRNLAALAQVDVLTGLANRRYFMARLEAECLRRARAGQSLCLVMIDADHFKKVNDVHGHQVGDEVLRAIAGVLAELMRVPADLPGRLGGEEFALLLPDTRLSGARALCERVSAALARRTFEGAGGPFRVTVSMGLVEGRGQSPSELMLEADANLYQAKHSGRNCIVASADSRREPEPERDLGALV